MRLRVLLLVVCGVSLFSVEASARHIFWQLRDVQFSDGALAGGRFIYDADSNEYSFVLIITNRGRSRPGAVYTTASPTSNRIMGLFFTKPGEDQKGLPGLDLFYTRELTNEGGVVPLAAGFGLEMTCANASCSVFGTPQRLVTGGYLEGRPLDEPDSTSMSGSDFRSTDKIVAAALLGGFRIQAQVPSSQHPLPTPIPSWIAREAYRSARRDSRELTAAITHLDWRRV